MSGGRKSFFVVYDVTIAACCESLSFQQIFSPKEKKCYIVSLFFLFYLKKGNLIAASLACIGDFVDKNAWRND